MINYLIVSNMVIVHGNSSGGLGDTQLPLAQLPYNQYSGFCYGNYVGGSWFGHDPPVQLLHLFTLFTLKYLWLLLVVTLLGESGSAAFPQWNYHIDA